MVGEFKRGAGFVAGGEGSAPMPAPGSGRSTAASRVDVGYAAITDTAAAVDRGSDQRGADAAYAEQMSRRVGGHAGHARALDAPAERLEQIAAAAELQALRKAARAIARAEVSDAVATAFEDYGKGMREFERESGIDAATVSRLVNGRNEQGGTVATLAQIALGMGKTLKIVIE